MDKEILDETIELLTKEMIRDRFENKDKKERYIITKQQLYQFSIKLIKLVKEVNNA